MPVLIHKIVTNGQLWLTENSGNRKISCWNTVKDLMISIAKAVLCLICVSDSFVLYFMPITMYIYIPKLISKLFLKIVQHYILTQNLLQLAGCFRSIQWIQDYAYSACKQQALCRLPSICPHLQTGGCPQLEKNWWQNVVEQNTSIVGVGYIITYIHFYVTNSN